MLPSDDRIFLRYFDRWYDPDDRARRVYKTTKPDAVEDTNMRGLSADEVSPLTDASRSEVSDLIAGMIDAARADWPTYLPVSEPIDITWIDEFDRYYDRRHVETVLTHSDPRDFSNDLLVLCCEFGAVLGHVLLTMQPDLQWLYDWPYWESSVFDSETGTVVNVFHWAIKKFSKCGIDDGFCAKILACSEFIQDKRMQA